MSCRSGSSQWAWICFHDVNTSAFSWHWLSVFPNWFLVACRDSYRLSQHAHTFCPHSSMQWFFKKCSFCAAYYSSPFQLIQTSKVHFIATCVISQSCLQLQYTQPLWNLKWSHFPFFLTFNKTSEFTARGGAPFKRASSFFSFTDGRGNWEACRTCLTCVVQQERERTACQILNRRCVYL